MDYASKLLKEYKDKACNGDKFDKCKNVLSSLNNPSELPLSAPYLPMVGKQFSKPDSPRVLLLGMHSNHWPSSKLYDKGYNGINYFVNYKSMKNWFSILTSYYKKFNLGAKYTMDSPFWPVVWMLQTGNTKPIPFDESWITATNLDLFDYNGKFIDEGTDKNDTKLKNDVISTLREYSKYILDLIIQTLMPHCIIVWSSPNNVDKMKKLTKQQLDHPTLDWFTVESESDSDCLLRYQTHEIPVFFLVTDSKDLQNPAAITKLREEINKIIPIPNYK